MNPCETICIMPPCMPCSLKMKKPSVTNPMCEIDEYAISFFMSVCTSATSPMYTTAISDSVIMKVSRYCEASGAIGRLKRRNP
jgi:hypothetical protein